MSANYLGNDDPLCAQCSRLSGGCCTTSLEDTAYCFPLSEGEIQRLMPYAHLATHLVTDSAPHQATSLPSSPLPTIKSSTENTSGGTTESDEESDEERARQAVCSPEKNSSEFIKSMGYLFPTQTKKIADIFPPTGSHYRLKLKENGACTFLGEEGCRLPRGVRPWYCLLFPAWFQSGELTVFISDVCLATKDVTDPHLVLQQLNIPEQSAREIFYQLIADWGFSED